MWESIKWNLPTVAEDTFQGTATFSGIPVFPFSSTACSQEIPVLVPRCSQGLLSLFLTTAEKEYKRLSYSFQISKFKYLSISSCNLNSWGRLYGSWLFKLSKHGCWLLKPRLNFSIYKLKLKLYYVWPLYPMFWKTNPTTHLFKTALFWDDISF